MKGILREDICAFIVISRWVLLRMRNVSDKRSRENQNTHILCSITSPLPPTESHAVNEIMWKNILDPGRPQMTIWRMRFACRITKVTHTLPIGNTYCFFTYGNSGYANAPQAYIYRYASHFVNLGSLWRVFNPPLQKQHCRVPGSALCSSLISAVPVTCSIFPLLFVSCEVPGVLYDPVSIVRRRTSTYYIAIKHLPLSGYFI
jgi:hypothetical protein